ncbi:MAG: Hsp70 family protein, partial [bacterium]
SKEDIEKMKKEAEIHADEDKKKKEEVEKKNIADQMIYTAEKALKDAEGKITDEIKTSVQAKIDALKTARAGSDIAALQKASEELSTEMQKIGEAMAKANPQSEAGATPNQEGTEKKDDQNPEGNVRDAETK